MTRRVAVGFLWFVAFYFAGAILVGAIAGGVAGVRDPTHASDAGALAGAQAVQNLRFYILGVAALLAAGGAWKGLLPGTRSGIASSRSGGD